MDNPQVLWRTLSSSTTDASKIAELPMRVLYDRDADLSLVRAKRVGVIGYGAQGHAHALNLRDSGVDVVVALHQGAASAEKARAAGFSVVPVSEAARTRDVLVMCAPDEVLPDLYAA